jgi:transcriptional regulator with XRE-family HTH domain
VRELREDMGLTGLDFAARMTIAARELELAVTYDKVKLSKIETGVRDLSLEDVAVIERVAPKNSGGWFRVAFGRDLPPEPRLETGAKKMPLQKPQRGVVPKREHGG